MKRSCKNTTDSNHNLPIAPNISNRDFNASRTDEKICRRYYLHSKKEIFEYTEFYYNRHSNHSYLGNLSPVKFEEKQKVLRNEMVAQGYAKLCMSFSYLSSKEIFDVEEIEKLI